MNTRRPSGFRRDAGFSLIVSLMMLVVIIVLGISASQMAINEERGSRNDRDRQIAFQAAEAALKDAEFEILDPASPACSATPAIGHGRTGTNTCFNASNSLGFVTSATQACAGPPNAGLCAYDRSSPAWLRPAADPGRVDFVADAKGTGLMMSVRYGQYTGRTYGSQATSSGKQLSIYPPRYIIERVPRNTSSDTLTGESQPYMFRITALGFGASVNTQVVLQTVVSTPD